MTIYLNSAGHGLPSDAALRRMISHLELEQTIGATAAFERAAEELSRIHKDAATLIGARPEDTRFSTTTTATWFGLAASLPLAGKRILVAPHEWGDNIRLISPLATQCGARIEVLPPLDLTAPDLSTWAARIDDDVAAIFTPMVTSVQGLLYPVEAIGALPRPESCFYMIDAAQALGQVPIDVTAIGCDALVATCRKWLRAPRNTALFWVNPAKQTLFHRGNLGPFEANVALRLGLGTALADALKPGVARIRSHLISLRDEARVIIADAGFDRIAGPDPMTGALCLAIPKARADGLIGSLAAHDIVTKTPNPQQDEPFAPALPAETMPLRLSLNLYNTADDLACLARAVRAAE
ncbi:aminotransferase class V-fold PLP-dependent enzyme [Thalassococcus sp. S3]|uniref:aminotransferase class V-fold PLP-dependent enzyme n=1 Tax=Thalassococcus sp. S3 TaxID=2017482 RepID=UPI0010245707|nr:aminotransferase class V-fold PLP-dependent enzyme [Thalassococcus sp. S3]QBF34182.1 hypothetical protein CFI11_23650 [Thalassococcus sp. S3]